MTWIAWTFVIFIGILTVLNLGLIAVMRGAVAHMAAVVLAHREDLEAAEKSVEGQRLLIGSLITSVQELSPDADIILQHALSQLSTDASPSSGQTLH